jgi:hypothetical protein
MSHLCAKVANVHGGLSVAAYDLNHTHCHDLLLLLLLLLLLQPGMVKVGSPLTPEAAFVPTVPNPVCSCCPQPPPQAWYYEVPTATAAPKMAPGMQSVAFDPWLNE